VSYLTCTEIVCDPSEAEADPSYGLSTFIQWKEMSLGVVATESDTGSLWQCIALSVSDYESIPDRFKALVTHL
jgi:hypothetical protein